MATTVHWYVDPDATGAGNGTSWTDSYTSLNAWEAAEQKDLSAATGSDEIYIVHCRSGGGTADTVATSVLGWTTASGNYIKVVVDQADRHDGKWNTSKYRLVITSGNTGLTVREDYVRIEGLQVYTDDSSGVCIYATLLGATIDIRISHNIAKGNGAVATNTKYGILGSSASSLYMIWNNIIFDIDHSFGLGIGLSNAGAIGYIYNNTIFECERGFLLTGDLTLKNNIVKSATDFGYPSGANVDSTHNVGNYSVSELAFGQTWSTGNFIDGQTDGHLIDSSEDFPTIGVQVRSVVENVTTSGYSYVTSVANGDLTLNDNIFPLDDGDEYRIYTNIFGSVTFENEGADDFHLSAEDIVARNKGTDLSDDSDLPFSDDIDGDTRS